MFKVGDRIRIADRYEHMLGTSQVGLNSWHNFIAKKAYTIIALSSAAVYVLNDKGLKQGIRDDAVELCRQGISRNLPDWF